MRFKKAAQPSHPFWDVTFWQCDELLELWVLSASQGDMSQLLQEGCQNQHYSLDKIKLLGFIKGEMKVVAEMARTWVNEDLLNSLSFWRKRYSPSKCEKAVRLDILGDRNVYVLC